MDAETRAQRVAIFARLDDEEKALLAAGRRPDDTAHPFSVFDKMVENVVGSVGLPLGIATNFVIDGQDRLIPMAVEEPSVVAAASNAAKMARASGGFDTKSEQTWMTGQVHLLDVPDAARAAERIGAHREEILAAAEPPGSSIGKMGGGSKDLEVRVLHTDALRSSEAKEALGHAVVVVHLFVDVRDAMGANAVNTRVERIAPLLEELSGGRVRLRILSNLADRRIVTARGTFDAEALGGPEVVQGILEAQWLAELDPYRAATHNKGVMNGVDAVVVATGNDWRATEAGAHAYAARDGSYSPLTRYHRNADGDLVGELSLPLALGTVGGATRVNPMARLSLKILGVDSAEALGRIACAVGLAQNLAALRALATEGIQKGHIRLHDRLADRAAH